MSEREEPDAARAEADAEAALGVVAHDVSQVRRKRRRRVVIQGALVTVLLVAGWIAVIAGLQHLQAEQYDLRAETETILEKIRDKKADQVYRDASPLFQRDIIPDHFSEFAGDINQAWGEFREILAIKLVESVVGPGGHTCRVKATVAFARGNTATSFSYHRHDEAWKLLHVDIPLTPALAKDVISRSETRAARKEAPGEVFDLAQKILVMAANGQNAEIWATAAPTFQQAIDREAFVAMQKERQRTLGKYVRILDTIQSARNERRDQATVAAVAQYDEGKATVTLGFVKLGDLWQLSHYKVVLPEPDAPRSSSRPP